ncbi:MAG TPA: bifunctional UDP-N-acetylmuramoyl-tripeptide:D-alanyl-D-alanine ligase/alanine racemase [Chitinophagaceae bacterium]|nr:bifunctional UDP-N-acetylmuramoyl-tripeptide:D-alanyl-D-alanine ligase/alanine racemase [Chitinophagaceae bacterium]
MAYSISHIAAVLEAESTITHDTIVEHLLTDSRKVFSAAGTLFFCLKSTRRDGHQFVQELYKKGVRNFVVSDRTIAENFIDANFIFTDDVLQALQDLAAYHRRQFNYPVIGITGSNGKTIIKEWLYQLLHEDYNIVRSPKSYNSQIGVPLSVWQMNEQHKLGIFEAGISEQGEMFRLEKIIRPGIGILTNIGEAHGDGFIDTEHKFREKVSLFKNSKVIIGRDVDFGQGREVVEMMGDNIELKTWGTGDENDFVIRNISKSSAETIILVDYGSFSCEICIPFIDNASVENAIICCSVMLYLGVDTAIITKRFRNIHPVNMRLELKKGINHCTIINDSYSTDLNSLEIALNFLDQQAAGARKTIILSDFLQSRIPDAELYQLILDSLQGHQISRLIAIGPKISAIAAMPVKQLQVEQYESTESFMGQFRSSGFKEEAILVKGARSFYFEQIVSLLQQKVHQTVLEINLNAIAHNLKEYQKLLNHSTRVMAMVKAFAYGSGGAEIAGVLQFHKADYLGVAYADEGIELRKAGISLPIMVMNPDENAFESIVEYKLEPELYSFVLLQSFDKFLQQEGLEQYPIHIEIETGMNRLGFAVEETDRLANYLLSTSSFRIQSVFSHLAASGEKEQDEFTISQFKQFEKAADKLKEKTGYNFLRHIANSAATVRMPQLQMDMVRLGIGLYGVDNANSGKLHLQTVATLKSTVAQIKHLKKGESVGYNRKTVLERDSFIATIRIGYADGYPRRLGNGAGKVWINGKSAPVSGTVCMDMIMADVTDIKDVKEGDEVIIFGDQLPVQQLAAWAGTIPYEIMTGISQRVKRIYYEE